MSHSCLEREIKSSIHTEDFVITSIDFKMEKKVVEKLMGNTEVNQSNLCDYST